MDFAPRMSRFKPSPSQIASARVRELQAEGRDIIKLTAGEPDFPTPDHAKAAAIEVMDRNEIHYTPINGTLPMREAARLKLKRDNGLDYDLDQIAVGSVKRDAYGADELPADWEGGYEVGRVRGREGTR